METVHASRLVVTLSLIIFLLTTGSYIFTTSVFVALFLTTICPDITIMINYLSIFTIDTYNLSVALFLMDGNHILQLHNVEGKKLDWIDNCILYNCKCIC